MDDPTDRFASWKPKDLATLTGPELEQYRDECYQARLTNKDRTGYGMAERVRLLEEFQRATRELNKRQNNP